jgi:hypothetical protein
MPGVYLRSRRLNATRFTTLEKVGQVGAQAWFIVDEVEAKLRAAPPAALVISAGDYLWMKEGVDRFGRRSAFTLAPWIDEHYRRVQEIPRFGNIDIFQRKDLLAPVTLPSSKAVAGRAGGPKRLEIAGFSPYPALSPSGRGVVAEPPA